MQFRRKSNAGAVGPAVIALLTGLVITTAVSAVAWNQSEKDAKDALAVQGISATGRVSEGLELAVARVRSLQAFFEASNEITEVEFSRFSLHQGTSSSINTVGFAPVVPPDEFATFASNAIADRPHYVPINTLRRPVTEPDRDVIPVWYGHQYRLMPPVLGLDLADDPDRRQTIETTLKTNRLAVSPFVEVLGGTGGPFVEIYAPVHDKANGRRGVVFATLEVSNLIPANSPVMAGTTIEISDVTDATYSLPKPDPSQWSGVVTHDRRTWLIDLRRENPLTERSFTVLALAAGIAISVLAAATTYTLVSSQSRKRKLADLEVATEEKDAFLASVAHELRTPLTSIVGVTALLADEPERLDTTEKSELAAIAHHEATELAYLIEDILVGGRLAAGAINYRPESLNLNLEIRRVLGRVGQGPKVDFHLPASGITVHADPLRVRQIIRNVVLGAVRNANDRVEITADTRLQHVHLVVRNDGPPLPSQVAQELLKPDRPDALTPRPGTLGHGLPVSSRLADAMGGSLTYSYSDNWGTFVVRLPLSTSGAIMELTEPASALAPHTTTQTRSPS